MTIHADAIGQIIDAQWSYILDNNNSYQVRTMDAIRRCRTASLGGHAYQCNRCAKVHIRYNSCRNRHCSQCQNTQREEWVLAQERKVIETDYYHIVFTLPSSIHEVCMAYPREMYAMVMRTAWQVIDGFGWNQKYLGAQIGATMVLHTWGSTMSYHPHVHCIVPGGGVSYNGKWKNAKGKGKYLFPVKAMSQVFRAKMVKQIDQLLRAKGLEDITKLKEQLYKTNWVVYAKPPFGGTNGVIRYLSRYTHNIAISHHRIKHYDDNKVSFSYKDYRHGSTQKVMTLTGQEFVRRFALHILPKGMCRIRHYGILSGAWKNRLFELPTPEKPKTWEQTWQEKGLDVRQCPFCKSGKLEYLDKIKPVRGPPYTKHSNCKN